MNKAKHTPRPWQLDVEAFSAEGCRDIIGAGSAIASTHGLSDDAEDLANACLMVAAPSLLAAAECALALSMTPTSEGYAVLRRHGFHCNPDLREADFSQACAFVDSLCRAAIAKATGAAS